MYSTLPIGYQRAPLLSDLLRGAADGNGATAGLRQWRVGSDEGHPPIWTHTHHASGGF